MPKLTAQSGAAIEQLLQERNQYEQWLARLAASGATAPDAVRAKIRTDYESRLAGVIDQLRTHSATIAEDLSRFRGSQAELEQREASAQETLAEAEVRHAVGEYEEGQWQGISETQNRALAEIREELSEVRAEITRLADVQSLIATAPARPPETGSAPGTPAVPGSHGATSDAAGAGSAGAPAGRAESGSTSEPAPSQARFAPKPPGGPGRQPQGDELDFLKSVTTGGARTTSQSPSTAAAPGGADAARNSGGHAAVGAAGSPPKAAPPGQAKTLKCAECGTLNRPTEWYCERCGAELAAL